MTDQSDITDWSRLCSVDGGRMAIQESGERIRSAGLTTGSTGSREYRFELGDTSGNGKTQHRVQIDPSNGQLHHREWCRYTFNLADETSSESEEVEFVVELPAETDTSIIGTQLTVTGAELAEAFDQSNHSVPVNRVAGLDVQKQQLRRFLQTDNSDWGLSNRSGILLEGPPGTGKTELVIETCEELFGGLPVTISGPEILSKWVGESERLLRKQFQEARGSTSQVLYIDEIDAIARSRSESTQEHSAQLVAQLLVLLDGIDAKKEDTPKVVASTNLAEVLDPALLRPGRLGNQPITFSRPDTQERMAIFHHYFEQIRTSSNGRLDAKIREAVTDPLNSGFLENLATETDGYTGADIEDTIVTAVTHLQAKQHNEFSQLTPSTIHDRITERNIQPQGPSFTEESIVTEATDSVQLHGNGQLVQLKAPITDEDIQSITSAWKQYVDGSDDEFVVRTVPSNQLIGPTPTETRDRVVTVFHHKPSTSLCLYLSDLPSVTCAVGHTSLADTVLETIHEQLLQWNEQNLLIYGQNKTDQSYLSAEHLDISE
ncbi:AAA family ATPase [Natronosalvus amylolyticus]|uniref:AAA family ATPase n=1 Tax=Natronosalvus amylolyticus TaxID=2961994 RepID=UPI0020C9AAD1|nr:ATP-binding protein [Natronosalvus amylolyticus]